VHPAARQTTEIAPNRPTTLIAAQTSIAAKRFQHAIG
jgi:hypothetical protein